MGTPIRQILKSGISSPLSPSRINKIQKIINSVSPIKKTIQKNGTTPKCKISFNALFKQNNLLEVPCKNSLEEKFEFKNNIRIEVTDCSTKLILNIGTKNELMQNGLSNCKNLKILGKGTFGTVVEGFAEGRPVALKVVKLNNNKMPFQNESNALNFDHKNVIKLIDMIFTSNSMYGIIVMEYVKFSKSLQNILEDLYVDVTHAKILKYALNICQGLEYCHQKNVMHLDLKPSNVLVSTNDLCKLCDFGNSVKLDENVKQGKHWVVGGTVPYAAPELLLGHFPTFKCDIYSLGILMWQMRHREVPYAELRDVEVIIYKVVKLNCRPQSICNDKYFLIYSKCWSFEVSSRPSISEIINLLST